MRISSLISTASVAVAITTATVVLGARTAEPILILTASPTPTQSTAPDGTGATEPTAPAETTAPDQNNQAQDTTAANPQETSASQTQAPDQTQAPAEPTTPAAPTTQTLTSDEIAYKYGVVQVSVTKTGDQITDVALLKGDASYGRDVAYQTLIQATLESQGTNYGNVSGATFTTEAFKLAVENALAKR